MKFCKTGLEAIAWEGAGDWEALLPKQSYLAPKQIWIATRRIKYWGFNMHISYTMKAWGKKSAFFILKNVLIYKFWFKFSTLAASSRLAYVKKVPISINYVKHWISLVMEETFAALFFEVLEFPLWHNKKKLQKMGEGEHFLHPAPESSDAKIFSIDRSWI